MSIEYETQFFKKIFDETKKKNFMYNPFTAIWINLS